MTQERQKYDRESEDPGKKDKESYRHVNVSVAINFSYILRLVFTRKTAFLINSLQLYRHSHDPGRKNHHYPAFPDHQQKPLMQLLPVRVSLNRHFSQ